MSYKILITTKHSNNGVCIRTDIVDFPNPYDANIAVALINDKKNNPAEKILDSQCALALFSE